MTSNRKRKFSEISAETVATTSNVSVTQLTKDIAKALGDDAGKKFKEKLRSSLNTTATSVNQSNKAVYNQAAPLSIQLDANFLDPTMAAKLSTLTSAQKQQVINNLVNVISRLLQVNAHMTADYKADVHAAKVKVDLGSVVEHATKKRYR